MMRPGSAPAAVRETRFHHSRMRDEITVLKRKTEALDDEEHEENPHLEDFLVPKNAVHIPSEESVLNLQQLMAGLEMEDDTEVKKEDDKTEDTKDESEVEKKEDDFMLAGIEEEEDEEDGKKDVDGDAAVSGEADAGAGTSAMESAPARPQSKKPILLRPDRSVLHLADSTCRKSCEKTEKRRKVSFDKVVVRDYGMILGDHPSCQYGPPVTLEWDYLEYEELSVDEYEYHHSRRRPLRLLGINYYRRKKLLLENMGYSEEDLKAATKEVRRVQINRTVTKNFAPFHKVDFAIESARRKAKRIMKKEKKSR
eukprot:CAMPEP_0197442954 /NCGR_PEP_ID=MMETSP1175-20131217/8839_1 /TAXON_ID=1003142 /ORGANISM="Triceratium dubium, Strain CCMP147" /LENGTH=310 /DNA_ID=CAMNT_0042973523 /DNA_START=268 /DNA_END=1200 /DNA_ORIENTATION=-